jgi:hypothetical protein
MRTKPLAALFGGALIVAASCSGAFSGTYADEAGITSYEFRADGRVHISVLGATVAAEYKIDGDRVLVTSPQGTVVLTRNDDRLYGPMGLELVRQRE